VTVNVPVLVPPVVGLNVTLIVQLPPAATDEEQLFVCAKSPLVAMLVIVTELLPLFVKVTV